MTADTPRVAEFALAVTVRVGAAVSLRSAVRGWRRSRRVRSVLLLWAAASPGRPRCTSPRKRLVAGFAVAVCFRVAFVGVTAVRDRPVIGASAWYMKNFRRRLGFDRITGRADPVYWFNPCRRELNRAVPGGWNRGVGEWLPCGAAGHFRCAATPQSAQNTNRETNNNADSEQSGHAT